MTTYASSSVRSRFLRGSFAIGTPRARRRRMISATRLPHSDDTGVSFGSSGRSPAFGRRGVRSRHFGWRRKTFAKTGSDSRRRGLPNTASPPSPCSWARCGCSSVPLLQHDPRECHRATLERQVQVVAHQAVGQYTIPKPTAALGKAVQIDFAIPVVAKDRLTLVTARHHVVDPACELHPLRPRQCQPPDRQTRLSMSCRDFPCQALKPREYRNTRLTPKPRQTASQADRILCLVSRSTNRLSGASPAEIEARPNSIGPESQLRSTSEENGSGALT